MKTFFTFLFALNLCVGMAQHYNKDGTPDMRYKENKQIYGNYSTPNYSNPSNDNGYQYNYYQQQMLWELEDINNSLKQKDPRTKEEIIEDFHYKLDKEYEEAKRANEEKWKRTQWEIEQKKKIQELEGEIKKMKEEKERKDEEEIFRKANEIYYAGVKPYIGKYNLQQWDTYSLDTKKELYENYFPFDKPICFKCSKHGIYKTRNLWEKNLFEEKHDSCGYWYGNKYVEENPIEYFYYDWNKEGTGYLTKFHK